METLNELVARVVKGELEAVSKALSRTYSARDELVTRKEELEGEIKSISARIEALDSEIDERQALLEEASTEVAVRTRKG